MGGGAGYTPERYRSISEERGYKEKSRDELFKNTKISAKNSVDSLNINARTQNTNVKDYMLSVGVRECRDTKEHPKVTGIGIILDVTGSMKNTPYLFVTQYFPKLMGKIGQAGVQDPEIMFMAVGDHECGDKYPIQMGQFETDPEKVLDQLQDFYLEGGGGSNPYESYLLGWIIAGYHTELDSFYKRGKKGFLFSIGDEPCAPSIPGSALKKFLNYQGDPEPITAKEAFEKASEQYHVFHIHITDTGRPFERVRKGWTDIVGQNLLTTTSDKVCDLIVDTILQYYTPDDEVGSVESTNTSTVEQPKVSTEVEPSKDDDLML